ncbi:MAG TPA: rhomboid family intramembrane serine protease [Chryseolinea sp.]
MRPIEPYITYAIIGFTSLLSYYAFSRPQVLADLMMTPYLIRQRQQYFRFISSGFIHNDFSHLLWNMFSFYFFGRSIEIIFKSTFIGRGALYFVLLYLLGIIVSDLPTYFKQKNNPSYHALGASGGVAAVIFASILLRPTAYIYVYFIPIPGFIAGTLYILYSYYKGRQSNDGVNHDAHLYGGLFGLVFLAAIYPQALPEFVEQIKHWDFFQR